MSTAIERIPRYIRVHANVLHDTVLNGALKCVAEGVSVSVKALQKRGVHGDVRRILAMRDQLIAEGKLPPECVCAYKADNSSRATDIGPSEPKGMPKREPVRGYEPDQFVRKMVDLYGRDKMRRQFARGK